MPNYRRAREGNTYFFTVVTYQRRPILCLEQSRALLRESITKVRKAHPFFVEAWALLPDHMHCVWRLPEGDMKYSLRWALIKAEFTKGSKEWLDRPQGNISRKNHGEATVWQRRFWEHMIRDDRDYVNHCDYVHYNPVKHGLVIAPREWRYSSFHRFLDEGLYPPDWGAVPIEIAEGVGSE